MTLAEAAEPGDLAQAAEKDARTSNDRRSEGR